MATDRLARVFRSLLARARKACPPLAGARLAVCPEAEREHKGSERQFAHTGHRPGVVCHARALRDLSLPWQAGVLAHEIGHLMFIAFGLDHSEGDANRFGGRLCGVSVRYAGPLRLEKVDHPPRWLLEEVQ